MKFLKQFDPFRKPQADALAIEMLEDAKRELLVAHANKEWAESQVERYQKAIARLTKEVK